jgi:hypothetical protein
MERHELRELVEDALEALKPRYQRTRTPFNLQTIREEVEDQHGAPLADDDTARIPGIMQRLWERRRGIEAGGAWRRVVAVRRPNGKLTGELLQREPDLQSDLVALNLAVFDRTAHLRDFEPAEIS